MGCKICPRTGQRMCGDDAEMTCLIRNICNPQQPMTTLPTEPVRS